MLDLETLYWRAPHSFDVKNKLKEIIEGEDSSALKSLLNYSLSEKDLNNIDRAANFDPLKDAITDMTLNIGLVSNSTVDFILQSLRSSALRYGINLNIIKHDYGQALEAVIVNGDFYDKNLDMVLVAFDKGMFELSDYLALSIIKNAKKNLKVPVIVQTVPYKINDVFGSSDLKNETSQKILYEFNKNIIEGDVASFIDLIVDVSHLASNVGLNNWYDERLFHLAKISFSTKYLPLYTECVTKAIASLKGKTGKCLILDLDNTIWGGVIGDDGLKGIKIGQGSPDGEAFVEFQKTIKSLKDRGVILAVCSKNDIENATEPFKKHPDMLLNEDDITLFVANWNDKASNIKYIAETLNIGLDSLVFVDDNPAEREQVRWVLPEVNVVEMPTDPSYYSRVLLASGAFENTSLTSDDKDKAEQYKIRQKAVELENISGNYEDYLKSLAMISEIKPFDDLNRLRITQLINKTNQFNLTTKRYTEEQVKEFEEDEGTITLQARLSDKFGEHGIVSLLIARIDQNILYIDTFLMSCRVLKRDLEFFMINHLFELAQTYNIETICGEYIATKKNTMVKDLYKKIGFEKFEKQWILDIKNYRPASNNIKKTN